MHFGEFIALVAHVFTFSPDIPALGLKRRDSYECASRQSSISYHRFGAIEGFALRICL